MKDKRERMGQIDRFWTPFWVRIYTCLLLIAGTLLATQDLLAVADQAASTQSTSSTASTAASRASSSPSSSTASGVAKQARPVSAAAPSGATKEAIGGSKRAGSKKKIGRLSEEQALKTVANRNEVKSWKRLITTDKTAQKRGCSAHIELDRKEAGSYVVHVFEEVPDGDGSSHTATFNWYHVNEKTGKVTTEF